MQYLALTWASALRRCLLITLLGSGLAPSGMAQTPVAVAAVAARPAAAATYSVQARTRGALVDIFFTAGDWVKRGQLLAKLELPDGTPAYLVAPAAGRISPARQHLGETVGARAVLAIIAAPRPSGGGRAPGLGPAGPRAGAAGAAQTGPDGHPFGRGFTRNQ